MLSKVLAIVIVTFPLGRTTNHSPSGVVQYVHKQEFAFAWVYRQI